MARQRGPNPYSHSKLDPEEKERRRAERASRKGPPKPTKGRRLATSTHCANGHRWTKEGTYFRKDPRYKEGVRKVCRICERASQRKHLGLPPIPDDTPFGTRNRDKTHCPAEHEYTEENTYWINGNSRKCVQCERS